MPASNSSASASDSQQQLQFLSNDQLPDARSTAKLQSPLVSAAIVRQEANLLRFPFFALGRKGLRNRKGLLVRGQSKLDDKTYDFEYRITCNSDDLYPGQLSRKVHMGLLRIMQLKQSFPFANPIQFTWRELMETIGVTACGPNLLSIKQAIRSTEGTRIRSKFALKNAHGKHLKGRERGYGLYSEYVFFDELMPDEKTIADKNFVWLADWYLANINSLYCSPLDHGLWLTLDDESPIASRMYEFFTFNFAGDWKTLTIDYEKLHRFLPVAPKKHLSQIEQQLGKALYQLVDAGILAEPPQASAVPADRGNGCRRPGGLANRPVRIRQAGLHQLAVRPTRTILLYLLPPFTVAEAAKTSSAKPLHRLRVENVLVTVWDGPRVTLQREYVYDRKVGYADSFRVEDCTNLKRAIDQFVIWAESPKAETATPQKETEPAAA